MHLVAPDSFHLFAGEGVTLDHTNQGLDRCIESFHIRGHGHQTQDSCRSTDVLQSSGNRLRDERSYS